MSETFVLNVSTATTAAPWSTIKQQDYVHLSEGEVIFGAFVFSLLVVTAVLGNAVVCILLRFRYMRCTRYTNLICNYCCEKSTKPGSVGFMETIRNEDLWADDLPSSQHECSCGKACPPPQIGQKAAGSYLIFTANPVRNQFTTKKNQSSEMRLNRLGSSRLGDEVQPERRPTSEQYWVGKVHVRAVPRTDFQRGTSGRNGSITSLFLFNLSLADFLMAVFCIPTYIVTELIYVYWPLGEPMCKMMSYAQGISVFVSALTHVLISLDRFVLVYFPLRPRMSHRCAAGLLVVVWGLACIIPLPTPIVNRVILTEGQLHCLEDWSMLFPNLVTAISDNYTVQPVLTNSEHMLHIFGQQVELRFAYSLILMILQYFLPLGVICGTYLAIAIRVNSMQTPGELNFRRDQNLTQSRRKVSEVPAYIMTGIPFFSH
ncbi:hypothetical protein P879_03530 [Paragonimus westermani]|uniref:G-protein coupled receptors family 1 profile domain-containing protein n=1 Tax=Paragonimus westermani TaxID=34504 RepID=A0A8T0DNY7_9TREM|nr:hypothetical protein P879_03530 [Paragonimus westermani]